MVSMNHTMTFCLSKNKIIQIVGTSFGTKKKTYLICCYSEKPVEIAFEQTIDNIKEVNRNYLTPYLYDCSDTTNNTNDDIPLSLTTG